MPAQERSMGLQPLQLVPLMPDAYTERAQAMSTLRRIGRLEISNQASTDSHQRRYVINISWKLSQSHIPTNLRVNGPPDVRVEREYAEFIQLRKSLLKRIDEIHRMMPCALCRRVMECCVLDESQSLFMLKLMYKDISICNMVNQFVKCLLKEILQSKTRSTRRCLLEKEVPLKLKAFLLPVLETDVGPENE
ncbi:hypothetical protein Poli38472_002649 [Pythium oligandrum]|uniref:PX domain-containing protein n=1 Tax=Pythium oligandrum TaxID=41045 RepID=A0A8K1CIR6_PYTOL|nr:hypothetical protein Poli38472_002649 [Pythium oligandrum]|eukprot:TMW63708.1 hypothetical protein Poli38472_002649 [Pythium oligandrum]